MMYKYILYLALYTQIFILTILLKKNKKSNSVYIYNILGMVVYMINL